MADSRQALLLGIAIGLGAGFLLGVVSVPSERTASPSYSLSTATGCVADPTQAGWVGQVPTGETRTVVLNLTVIHDAADIDVRGNLTETAPGAYRFTVTTSPGEGGKGEPPGDCQPRTTIDASLSLPGDYRDLRIRLDDEVVATVHDPDGSFARFRTLSGTWNVTGG